MGAELSPTAVAAALLELRRYHFALQVERRLNELRALNDLTRHFERARRAGLLDALRNDARPTRDQSGPEPTLGVK